MNTRLGRFVPLVSLFISTHIFATAYSVPPPDQSLIGQMQYRSIGANESPGSLALHYDLGHNALQNANPQVNLNKEKISSGAMVIPTQHLLPNQKREGIIINLPEMRMYYFPPGTNQVLTYPIGIGKIGKTIPITQTAITRKVENPTWVPPDDIREFNLEQGIVLPKVMPPGPDNPLGPYAIYMRVPTYLIHSTIFPESVGKRASFGCIRMFETDIKEFFPSIEGGIPVAIINTPVKVNWQRDKLFMEAHHSLEEHNQAFDNSLPGMVHEVTQISKDQPVLVDWQLISYLDKERDGMPHEIGIKLP